MKSLLKQLKKRRTDLGLKQNDMMLRAGVSRQQYQRLESKGNPRLDTLELIAKGLNSEIMLIPKEHLNDVLAALEGAKFNSAITDNSHPDQPHSSEHSKANKEKTISDDPWQNLLGDDS